MVDSSNVVRSGEKSKLSRLMPPTWFWIAAMPVLVVILMVAFFYHE